MFDLSLLDFEFDSCPEDSAWKKYFNAKYVCKITKDGKELEFPYTCGPQTYPEKKDCLMCLVSDSNAYESYPNDLIEFLIDFGYYDSPASLRTGAHIYDACKQTNEGMKRLFTETEMKQLNEMLEDW